MKMKTMNITKPIRRARKEKFKQDLKKRQLKMSCQEVLDAILAQQVR